MAKRQTRKSTTRAVSGDTPLYTLDAFIISGPITKSFARKNKVVSRTIQIRGDQTLQDLHHILFDAFDREQEHMYEFQIGGTGPMDPKARRYVLSVSADYELTDRRPAGDIKHTTIESLGLKIDDAFGYWFDFGDDWWHQINVVAIDPEVERGKFPKVIKRTGESPPQYPDWDEEDL